MSPENTETATKTQDMQTKLKEAKEAAPALFAKEGDTFMLDFCHIFDYLGRASDGRLKFISLNPISTEDEFIAMCKEHFCYDPEVDIDFYTTETMQYESRMFTTPIPEEPDFDLYGEMYGVEYPRGVARWRIIQVPPDECGLFKGPVKDVNVIDVRNE